jgi:DNA (cytosine-5)-methyltransferase 1
VARSRDLRARRLELGLAQAAVAKRAKVSATQLRKWERGLATPPPPVLKRLARILKVDAAALARAHARHRARAIPGEGYTTAEAAKQEVVARKRAVPAGSRRVLDLFCGCGGFSFGFEQTGAFAATCGVDLLADRVRTFAANHEHAVGLGTDLLTLSPDDITKHAGNVDVVLGGPPCQGFSSIRPFRTLTEGDPRNSLPEQYVLLISKLRPRWFVFENVVGILTHQKGERLAALVAGLRAAGYRVSWRVVNAALFGVPQQRERVILVGSREQVEFVWPTPTHRAAHRSMAGDRPELMRAKQNGKQLREALSLMDAIGDLPEVAAGQSATGYASAPQNGFQREMRRGSKRLTLHKATRHTARMLEIIRHAGANIHALPPGMVTSGFSSCYSRLDADRPSTTLTVNFVHPASNRCIHPFQDRALTPREGARLQSFPDSFAFHGSGAQIVKQIGNAVAPMVARALAVAILESEARANEQSRKRRARPRARPRPRP